MQCCQAAAGMNIRVVGRDYPRLSGAAAVPPNPGRVVTRHPTTRDNLFSRVQSALEFPIRQALPGSGPMLGSGFRIRRAFVSVARGVENVVVESLYKLEGYFHGERR